MLKAVEAGETEVAPRVAHVPENVMPDYIAPPMASQYDVPAERFGAPLGTEIPVLAAQWEAFWDDEK
jgi:hypothetical protein